MKRRAFITSFLGKQAAPNHTEQGETKADQSSPSDSGITTVSRRLMTRLLAMAGLTAFALKESGCGIERKPKGKFHLRQVEINMSIINHEYETCADHYNDFETKLDKNLAYIKEGYKDYREGKSVEGGEDRFPITSITCSDLAKDRMQKLEDLIEGEIQGNYTPGRSLEQTNIDTNIDQEFKEEILKAYAVRRFTQIIAEEQTKKDETKELVRQINLLLKKKPSSKTLTEIHTLIQGHSLWGSKLSPKF